MCVTASQELILFWRLRVQGMETKIHVIDTPISVEVHLVFLST